MREVGEHFGLHDSVVSRVISRARNAATGSGLVPCIAKPVAWYAQKHTQGDDAIWAAYASGGFSMREVGEHFGLHYSVVSRVISRARNKT